MEQGRKDFSYPREYVSKDFNSVFPKNTEAKITKKDEVCIFNEKGELLRTFLAPHGYEFTIKDEVVSVQEIEEGKEV